MAHQDCVDAERDGAGKNSGGLPPTPGPLSFASPPPNRTSNALHCIGMYECDEAALTMLLDCKMFSILDNCDEILHSVGVLAHGNRGWF